tara:strand:- start:576 stop:710 length:135 start_codon:yes stop_codon:yes gene_type:complete
MDQVLAAKVVLDDSAGQVNSQQYLLNHIFIGVLSYILNSIEFFP